MRRHLDTLSSERGSAPSTIIMLVALFMLAQFIVAGGRVAAVQNDVSGAAREAARQSSLLLNESGLYDVARTTAMANLEDRDRACESTRIETRGTDFDGARIVKIKVSCSINLNDLGFLPIPLGQREFSSTATEIIETYRATES